MRSSSERWRTLAFNLAAFVVVIAGIKSASAIIVTLLVALFVALITAPLSIGLKNRGVPKPLGTYRIGSSSVYRRWIECRSWWISECI